MKFIQFLMDWSEVWPLLIPLAIFLFFRPKGKLVYWLITYVILALILNTIAIFMVMRPDLVPSFLLLDEGNNLYYNLHSFIMVICFSNYILSLKKNKYKTLLRFVLFAYILFVVINFTFYETPLILSALHFTIGSIVLLAMCVYYFLQAIMEEDESKNWLSDPSFIICSGLFFYEVITFVIFLFFYKLDVHVNISFARVMFKIYQYMFVIFCLLIGIGFYMYGRLKKRSLRRTTQ